MFSRYDRLNTVNSLVSGAGYELNPERGWFSVVIPEATTNLITNPRLLSPLGALTGYTAVAGSIAATGNWQAIGSYGLAMTPAASTESGAYYGTISLTSGTTYTASVVLQGEAGKLYYIYFATTAGAVLGTKRAWRATGYKQRIWVTYPETSTTTRRVYVTRASSYADTNVFYSGSWQVEAKSYPTSYCDGNMQGFLPGEVAYWWNGIPDGSTSTRSSQTRSGGKEVNLLDYGLRILAIVGLGMAPLIDQALTLPGLGEYPIGTGTMARTFTLAGQMEASGPRHMQALHSGLINLFKPDAVSVDQPMILRYQAFDGEDAIGESVDIVAKYRGGLEGNYVNHNQEPVSLTFKQYIPQLQNTYDSGASLGTFTLIGSSYGLISQDPTTGNWQSYGAGGFSAGTSDTVFDPKTGRIYVADFLKVKYYEGSVITIGTGDSSVSAVSVDTAGNVYAGGAFTLMEAVAGTAYIAKYNGAVWTPLGTGMNGQVLVLMMAPDGKLYVGGAFTTGNGVALNGIGYWNGATFVAMGSGAVGGNVYAIVVDPNGRVYAAGSFTSMGGVANTAYIAYWEAGAWHSLSLFQPDNTIWALALGPDGTLYAGGNFLNVVSGLGAIGVRRVMKWTGTIWQEVGGGVDAVVYDLQIGPDGYLYACGAFRTAGTTALYSSAAIWNGWSWVPLNFRIDLTVFSTMAFNKQGSLYIGGDLFGANMYTSVSTVTVNGDSKTYPKFIITGPGKIFQAKNWVNGKILQFYNLTLGDGEVAVLDLNPLNLSFVSNTRGNLLPYIQSGTDLNWFLLPGTNYITSLMYDGVTASSSVVLNWRNQYWSMDGAINQ